MEIPENINYIEVYYDGECGICRKFAGWLVEQKRAFEVRLMAYQSEQAHEVFPEIDAYDPAKEMIVRTDIGEIYRGAEGWVMCLYSCEEHQAKARKMCSPLLLPMAAKVGQVMAANRYRVSGLFFRKTEEEAAAEIEAIENPKCDEGGCNL